MAGIDPNLVNAARTSKSGFELIMNSYNPKPSPNDIETAYQFYKGLSTSSTATTSSFSGGVGGSIDSMTDKIVASAGPFGKAFVAIDGLVKGVANLGDKIFESQMGVKDQDNSSKAIFEMFKNGGINPMKLLTNGLSTAFNEVLKQVEQESILLSEVGAKTGLIGDLGEKMRDDMIEASIEGARYGKTLQEIGQFYIELVESSGKLTLINQDIYDTAIPLASALNMNLGELSKTLFDYEKIGVGLGKSIENLEEATVNSLALGLSARKVTETMKNDISKLNEYGFQNGVRGLERMSQKAIEFRMNMSETFKIAEKVFEPEGALDLAANLQVLGGAFGAFNDPLKLMYMATNDVEGLQDALIGAAGSLATYNEEQGRFEITGINLRRARAMAQELGVEYTQLANGAIAAAERTSASAALMSSGLIMKDEDREFLTNISRMEDGEMKITVPKSLMDELGGRSEITLKNISEKEKALLLENREAFKEMSTKDIAMGQLTEIQQMSRGIDVIASYARVRAAEFIKENAQKFGGPLINDLKGKIESFSKEISQKNNVKQSDKIENTTSGINYPAPNRISTGVSSQNINPPSEPISSNSGVTPNNVNPRNRTNEPISLEGGRSTMTVIHEFKAPLIADSISREMIKNPDQLNGWLMNVNHDKGSYLVG